MLDLDGAERVVLYHPSNALAGIAVAEAHGLGDWAYASQYMGQDEVWITSDPDVVACYKALIMQKDCVAEAWAGALV